MAEHQPRLAVLIDADNVSPTHLGPLMAEIASLGIASVKRMYGDWTTDQLRGWKDATHLHSIQPVQQFAHTSGKNATDSALIIDAMDLLYTDRLEGFCLISSDSDFTKLASRLRESGVPVYGFGARKTPTAFVNACDRFTYFDVLDPQPTTPTATEATPPRPLAKELRGDIALVNLLREAIQARSGDDGWAHLSSVGSQTRNRASDFDPRNWGYAKLGDLVKAVGLFETKTSTSNGMLVRLKQK